MTVSKADPIVNVTEARVVGSVPPEAIAAVGAERKTPPPLGNVTEVMVPAAFVTPFADT